MCRKMETEEEKVLPFYASSLTAEEQEDVAAAVAEPPTEKLASVGHAGHLQCSVYYHVSGHLVGCRRADICIGVYVFLDSVHVRVHSLSV